VRKVEALIKALKKRPTLPNLNEWLKLWLAGFILLICFSAASATLVCITKSLWWLLLFPAGLLLYIWFCRASDILLDEEWKSRG